MFSNDYSRGHATAFSEDSDDGDSMFGGEDALFAASALGGTSRRNLSFDPTDEIGAYLAGRDSMKFANGKNLQNTKGRLTGKGNVAGKKLYTRGGRTYNGKTKPLKSVTSNQIHTTVFPNMRVPVYMRKHNGTKGRSGFDALGGSSRGLTTNSRGEDVPVMSVQCPMPGGTSVTVQTDPVQKVTWGPISRIEATGHARVLVKQLRQAAKASRKSKAERKDKGNDEKDSKADKGAAAKSIESTKTKESNVARKQCGNAVAEGVTVAEGFTREIASTVDEAMSDNNLFNTHRRGLMRAPPATPGDENFLRSPYSAAAMSMPTIPTMHHIADTKLVEHFRLLHASDPGAFENETREIKQGLIDAKIKRGGLSFLLREEYTVELASREGAEIAEKWAQGQARSREHPGLRSRGNSLNSQPSTGSLKMRGGDMEETGSNSEHMMEGYHLLRPDAHLVPHPSPASLVTENEHDAAIPALDLKASVPEQESSAVKPATNETKQGSKDDTKPKLSVKAIKKALSRLDIGENVSKVTTYGSVRHQSSLKREATDHGEKRTVKTWIEITEIYDVPAPQKLTVNDIADAIDQEQEDAHGSESDWESDNEDSDSESEPGEKEIGRKKRSKANKFSNVVSDTSYSTSTDGSDSEADSDSASDHDPAHGGYAYHNPNETGAESLLRSLLRLGEDTGDENLTRLGNDCNALIAGLGGEGLLRSGTDGQQTLGR